MSHSRSDVVKVLRGYHMFLRHVYMFPELHVLDRNVGRRVFVGYEDVSRMPISDLYVLATKCIIFHRYCSNFFWSVDVDLCVEILAQAKVVKPNVETTVNAWIAGFGAGSIPYRWQDLEGVNNWHVHGPNAIVWNFSA